MRRTLRQLAASRDLLWTWTGRLVQARYAQSVVGGLWVLVNPAATAAIFGIIFTLFVPVDTAGVPYVVFSYAGITPWLLFSGAITDMAASIVDNMQLVTKIYFPREILPMATLLARLLDFAVSLVLLVVLMLAFGVPLHPVGWLYVPFILVIQLALVLGLGLLLAAMNVFYRDVRPLLTLGVQLWFYASPVIYPVAMVPERLRPYYFLNPMAGILEAYRDVWLNQRAPGPYLAGSALASVVALVVGYWFFKHVEFKIADVI